MSQAFFTSISGISGAQSQLNVISDNISNINTPGFKETQLEFSNLYSSTLSSGSAPTSSTGGTNPIQYGLGVKVGEVSRNFKDGTVQSTNKNTDFNLSGNGFFSAVDSTGQVLFTRAGNFTLDGSGNLTTSNGDKVLGTNKTKNTTSSSDTIKLPPKLSIDVEPNGAVATKSLSSLNNANITLGKMTINVTNATSTTPVEVDLTGCTTVQSVADTINTALQAKGYISTDGNTKEVYASVGADGTFKMNCVNGVTDATAAGLSGGHNLTGLSFTSGTSDFPSSTQLSSATPSSSTTTINENATPLVPANASNVSETMQTYSSDVLDYIATIGPADSTSNTSSLNSSDFTVSESGAITAPYSNGGSLSVQADPTNVGSENLVYTTKSGVKITGSNLNINGGAIKASNLQMQLAEVVNPKGMISVGGNMFKTGLNSGDVTYSVGKTNGFGAVSSGGLEASNVDLSTQFANMIIAQRAIEANSRVFDTVNSTMQTLNSMGR